MKKYRVRVNLHKVYSSIRNYRLREFSGPFPIVDITAKSPDHACVTVKNNLLDLLKGQKGVNEDILTKVSDQMSIKRIQILDE